LVAVAVAGAAGSGPASQYHTCSRCVDAGYGWSYAKSGRCGNFRNKVCASVSSSMPPPPSPPHSTSSSKSSSAANTEEILPSVRVTAKSNLELLKAENTALRQGRDALRHKYEVDLQGCDLFATSLPPDTEAGPELLEAENTALREEHDALLHLFEADPQGRGPSGSQFEAVLGNEDIAVRISTVVGAGRPANAPGGPSCSRWYADLGGRPSVSSSSAASSHSLRGGDQVEEALLAVPSGRGRSWGDTDAAYYPLTPSTTQSVHGTSTRPMYATAHTSLCTTHSCTSTPSRRKRRATARTLRYVSLRTARSHTSRPDRSEKARSC
jgi:hypothetical protein